MSLAVAEDGAIGRSWCAATLAAALAAAALEFCRALGFFLGVHFTQIHRGADAAHVWTAIFADQNAVGVTGRLGTALLPGVCERGRGRFLAWYGVAVAMFRPADRIHLSTAVRIRGRDRISMLGVTMVPVGTCGPFPPFSLVLVLSVVFAGPRPPTTSIASVASAARIAMAPLLVAVRLAWEWHEPHATLRTVGLLGRITSLRSYRLRGIRRMIWGVVHSWMIAICCPRHQRGQLLAFWRTRHRAVSGHVRIDGSGALHMVSGIDSSPA